MTRQSGVEQMYFTLVSPKRWDPLVILGYNSSFQVLCQVKLKLTLCQVSRTLRRLRLVLLF